MTQSLQTLRIIDYKWAKEIGSVGCTTAKWKKHGYSAEAKKQHPWWWLYYLVKTNAECIIEEPCSLGPAFGRGGGGGVPPVGPGHHPLIYGPQTQWSYYKKIASPPTPPLIGSSSQPPKPVDFFPGDSSEQKWPSSPYHSYLLNVTIGLCLWMVNNYFTLKIWGTMVAFFASCYQAQQSLSSQLVVDLA